MGLFVGGQGSGKTVGAASFPGPVMFYDFDGRMTPVKRFFPDRDDINYITVGAYPNPRRHDAIDFQQFLKDFENLQDRCDYATIVLDSITSMTATSVRYQLYRKGPKKGKLLVDTIQVPTWDEFNGETQAVIELIEVSKILPCHVIYTAHPVDKTEIISKEESRKIQSITAFGNKTPSFIPNYFDEIYNFHKEDTSGGVDWVVTTQASSATLCKSALPLPANFSITGKGLFPTINEYLKEHEIKLVEELTALKEVNNAE